VSGPGGGGVAPWRSPRSWSGEATAGLRLSPAATRAATTSESRARSVAKAPSSTTGCGTRRIPPQAARSSIQAGISCERVTRSPTGLQRRTAPEALVITSWTRTTRPAHGCQAYTTSPSPTAVVPWAFCRRVVQRQAAALGARVREPGALRGD
jgi:hypothetical protein